MKQFDDEDALVKEIAGRVLPRSRGKLRLGIGDDAALWKPKPGFLSILTSDWFLEGTHFLREKHPPDSVGWKCLARAASDIAAMGGMPRCFLLNLAIPVEATGKWLDGFLGGLRRAARSLDCVLAGGDTTRSKRVLISVTVIGEIREGREVLRSGARDGDYICVSGRLGEAELGLRMLRLGSIAQFRWTSALRKHQYPRPRLELGNWLATNRIATSMIDVSDGLSTDLGRLCEASRVGALLDETGFPAVKVPRQLRSTIKDPLSLALHGGDDYELLFTAPREKLPSLPWKFKGLLISPIGVITSGTDVVWYDAKAHKGYNLRPGGWDPFR